MKKRWSRALVPVVCVVALTGALSQAAADDTVIALSGNGVSPGAS
jgi:hypothetical protein